MLFSRTLESLKKRSTAIEITAAGMEDEKVRPTFYPRYTLDAVKIAVINIPSSMPRNVSSGRLGYFTCESGEEFLSGIVSPPILILYLIKRNKMQLIYYYIIYDLPG